MQNIDKSIRFVKHYSIKASGLPKQTTFHLASVVIPLDNH